MSHYDEIACIRVNEAIQEGLCAQQNHRELPRNRNSISKTALILIFLVLLLTIFLGSDLLIEEASKAAELVSLVILSL